MASILIRGDSVYECDVCNRRVRIPEQRRSFDVVQRCIITDGCKGKLHQLKSKKEINDTPALTPEVAGLQDWAQHNRLYTHTQQVQSAKWTIPHKLACNPEVYVYVTTKVNGVVTTTAKKPTRTNVINQNTIELVFDRAESGLAQCIASSSANVVNPNATAGVVVNIADTVLTNLGELTIATLSTADNVTLSLTYNSPSSPQPVTLEYTGINKPSVYSAWAGIDGVVLNGRRYQIRSFNVATSTPAPTYFGQGAIVAGSTIAVSSNLKANEYVILLSRKPFASADINTQQYIDCSALMSNPLLYLNDGEVYAQPAAIKNTYPPIIVV